LKIFFLAKKINGEGGIGSLKDQRVRDLTPSCAVIDCVEIWHQNLVKTRKIKTIVFLNEN